MPPAVLLAPHGALPPRRAWAVSVTSRRRPAPFASACAGQMWAGNDSRRVVTPLNSSSRGVVSSATESVALGAHYLCSQLSQWSLMVDGLNKEIVQLLLALHESGGWSRPGSLGVWLSRPPSEYLSLLCEKGWVDRRQHISNSRFLRNKNKNSAEYRISKDGEIVVEGLRRGLSG